jgi:hypothetical protein
VKGKHDGTKLLTHDEYREGVFAQDGQAMDVCDQRRCAVERCFKPTRKPGS